MELGKLEQRGDPCGWDCAGPEGLGVLGRKGCFYYCDKILLFPKEGLHISRLANGARAMFYPSQLLHCSLAGISTACLPLPAKPASSQLLPATLDLPYASDLEQP